MEPGNFKAHYERSRLWCVRAQMDARSDKERAKKEYREAADCARRALALRSDHAMTHVILGMSLRELGMRKEAVDSFRTAIECSPDLVEAHLLLGETLLDAGQLAEARAPLESAARLAHPDDPRPRAAMARWKERK
jgi:tetratricopeptide (TPR) repeat protein